MGDSAFMGCVVQSTEEKHVVKVDWILSKGEHAVVRRRPAGVRMGVGESVIESFQVMSQELWEPSSLGLLLA